MSGYANAIRNSETIISNEEINQAENTSMNKNDSDETEVHTTDHRDVRKETDLNGEMEVETIDAINQNVAAILPKNVRAEKISKGVDQDKKVEGITSKFGSDTQSIESTFLRMAKAFNEPTSTADIGEKVGRDTVTPSLAPILKLIIERHGDIALHCTLSDRICCSILVEICKTVKNLQAIPFAKIQVHHLNSLAAIIADAEHVNIRVDWLQNRHDKLKETILMLNQYQSLKCSLQEKEEFITSTKEAIAMKKAEIVKIQSDCQYLESQRDSMVLEIEKVNGVINTVLSKYIFFSQKFLEGLC